MMRPLPVARIWGITWRLNRTVLRKLSSKADCQAESSKDSNLLKGGPPALFTRMSIFPNSFTAAPTKAAAASGCSTSTGMASTRPFPSARISAAVASRTVELRAPMTMSAPSAASRVAQALPRPLLAASTRAVFPFSCRSMVVKIVIVKRRISPFEKTNASAHPFFVFVVADTNHFPFAKPGQVDGQGRAGGAVFPEIHHPDLDFGGNIIRSRDPVGIFDLALKYPILPIGHIQIRGGYTG